LVSVTSPTIQVFPAIHRPLRQQRHLLDAAEQLLLRAHEPQREVGRARSAAAQRRALGRVAEPNPGGAPISATRARLDAELRRGVPE
jgi:hypothetical protein